MARYKPVCQGRTAKTYAEPNPRGVEKPQSISWRGNPGQQVRYYHLTPWVYTSLGLHFLGVHLMRVICRHFITIRFLSGFLS